MKFEVTVNALPDEGQTSDPLREDNKVCIIPRHSSFPLTVHSSFLGMIPNPIKTPNPIDTPSSTPSVDCSSTPSPYIPIYLFIGVGDPPSYLISDPWVKGYPVEEVRHEVQQPKKRVSPKGFEEWYELYPRKVARKDAETAFAKLLKDGVDIGAVTEATKCYLRDIAAHGTEMQYVKHPASFLRNERWRDYLPATGTPAALSDEEMASIKAKFEEGEYDEALVRKIEVKYGVKII